VRRDPLQHLTFDDERALGTSENIKCTNTKYKKYIGAILKNINCRVVYIAGAIQCGAEMLLMAGPPAISAVLAALQGDGVVIRQPNIVLPSVRKSSDAVQPAMACRR
jgi:hypothetical protein